MYKAYLTLPNTEKSVKIEELPNKKNGTFVRIEFLEEDQPKFDFNVNKEQFEYLMDLIKVPFEEVKKK